MTSNNISKYLLINPQAFSYTMLGLSTAILAYFVGSSEATDKSEATNKSEETNKSKETDKLATDKSSDGETDKSETTDEDNTIEEPTDDELDIKALLNRQSSPTETRGGKKKRKTKRRK